MNKKNSLDNSDPPDKELRRRWFVLGLMAALLYGNYYAYNSVVPLADALIRTFGISRAQYGLLFSYYSIPNFIVVLIGGILVDKIGVKKAGLIFATLSTAGILLTAVSPTFRLMLMGRLVYGLGAESLLIAETKILARWFRGKELSLAFGLNVTAVRLADVSALNLGAHIPTWTGSWRIALLIPLVFMIVGYAAFLIFLALDQRKGNSLGGPKKEAESGKFVFRAIFRFRPSFWLICLLCMVFYSAVFPFVAFSSLFLQRKFGLGPAQAGFYGSFVYISCAVFTPLFGFLVDRIGKRATIMIIGSLILVPALLLLGLTSFYPAIPMIGLGLAFSLVASALWPSIPLLVKEAHLGTAFGLTALVQNVGLTVFPWIGGKITDQSGGNFRNTLLLFASLGVVAFILSLLLRFSARKGAAVNIELPTKIAQG
jgi:predicted MFS family arabinose efflux permease